LSDSASAEEIVRRALEIDATERAAFLDRACGDDAVLRAEVELLLGGQAETADFPGTQLHDSVEPSPERPGEEIAEYRLLHKLGEGGFGTVWMAEQKQPVRRHVALKLIKPGMDSRQVIARFAIERQALAMMDHPGIARVFDAGTTRTGRPYFVMELVRGVPITRYCDRENLSTRDRLQLFVETCSAVQHAHQKGIIHRDIKPSNVLVTVVDGKPVPKVIDFGVAKATGGSLTDHTVFTRIGQFIGTPAYMSPEQVELTELDIDTRSDIYSLGVLLYELLTGTTPFDSAVLNSVGPAGIQRIVRELEPPRPSTRLASLRRAAGSPAGRGPSGDARGSDRSATGIGPGALSLEQVASRRRTDPASLRRLLRGDLDWIVMRAMEKDRTRRYETANGLAADVLRHLRGEPVVAAPPSPAYRARKFVRRNRGLVLAAAVVAAALVVGVAGTTLGLVAATRQRRLAEARASQLEQVARFQAEQLGGIDVPLMGLRLREDLIREARIASARDSSDRAATDARLAELERNLEGVDFTGLALHTLRENVFRRALDAVGKQFSDQPLVRARLLQTVADTAASLGLPDLADAPQAEALEIRRKTLGDDHPDTLASIDAATQLSADRGRLDEAEQLGREALEGRRRVLGDQHPDTLASIAGFGTVLYYRGRYADAERHFREALEGRRRVLGEDSQDTVSSMRSLGFALLGLGRVDQAVEIQRRALDICRRTLGNDAPGTVLSLNALATALKWQGKHEEAESLDREVFEARRRNLGRDHPETLVSLSELGADLQRQNKLDEAERCLREALDGQRRMLGEDNPLTLQTVGRLGVVLYDQGRYTAAEPYYREALERRRRVLGEDHADTIVATNNMGFLLMKMGRYAESEAAFRDALERSRRIAGDDHPNTLTYRHNLGRALAAEGRLDLAEAQLSQALAGRRRVRGEGHDETVSSMVELGRVLTLAGDYAGAEAALLEAWEAARSEAVRKELVALYSAWEGAQPGQGHRAKVKKWRDLAPQ